MSAVILKRYGSYYFGVFLCVIDFHEKRYPVIYIKYDNVMFDSVLLLLFDTLEPVLFETIR